MHDERIVGGGCSLSAFRHYSRRIGRRNIDLLIETGPRPDVRLCSRRDGLLEKGFSRSQGDPGVQTRLERMRIGNRGVRAA